MNYQTILTNLYFLLIHADGMVLEEEIALGHQLMKFEGMREADFKAQMQNLEGKNVSIVFEESLEGLRLLDRHLQIRCMAWLCLAANSDGFMDRTEWQFIYKIYHRELNLPLDEILKLQKELGKTFRQQPPQAVSITVL